MHRHKESCLLSGKSTYGILSNVGLTLIIYFRKCVVKQVRKLLPLTCFILNNVRQ